VPLGQNYCPQGHPIGLEQVQFAPPAQPFPTPYPAAAPAGGAKYAQAGANVAPSPPAPAYGAAGQGAFGAPPQYPPQPPAYPPPAAAAQAYSPPAAPAPQGYAAPPAAAPVYAAPAPAVDARATTVATAVPPTALTGFLVSFEGNPSGDFWPLHGGRHTVGRANSGETVDISLADATISSRHAILDVDAIGGKLTVEDTASTNGTFVNDDHIGFSGRRELRDGDRLRLGGFTTLVKVVSRG